MRKLPTGTYILIIIAVLGAALCVRLGFWQLSRLQERKAYNAMVLERLQEPPVEIRDLPRDTAVLRYRKAHVRGVYDYEHEIVLTNRSRAGSPGINILTPVRMPGYDTAVLVNRGWIYAPDGVHGETQLWHESDSLDGAGHLWLRETPGKGAPRASSRANGYRWFEPAAIQADFPYPVYPFVVVLSDSSIAGDSIPPRVPPPPLDEGSHASYAFQWFTFATIAIAGTIIFVRRKQKPL